MRWGVVLVALLGTACFPSPVPTEIERSSYVLVAHPRGLWRLEPPFSLYGLEPSAELLLYDDERAGYAKSAPGPIPTSEDGEVPLPRPSLVLDASGRSSALSAGARRLRMAGQPCRVFEEIAARDLAIPGAVRSLAQLDERHLLLTYADQPFCVETSGNRREIDRPPTMVVVDVDSLQMQVIDAPTRGTPTAWALPTGDVWVGINRTVFRMSREMVVTATESLGIAEPSTQAVLKLTESRGHELYALVVDRSAPRPSATVFRRDPSGGWTDLGPHAEGNQAGCQPGYDTASLVLTAEGRPRFTFRSGTVYELEESGWKRTVLVPDDLGPCRTSALQLDGLDLLVVQSMTLLQGVSADLFRHTAGGWNKTPLGLAGGFDLAPWNGAAIISGDFADGIDSGFVVEATRTDTLDGEQFRVCPGLPTGRPTPLLIHRLPDSLFIAAEGRGCSAWVSRLIEKR